MAHTQHDVLVGTNLDRSEIALAVVWLNKISLPSLHVGHNPLWVSYCTLLFHIFFPEAKLTTLLLLHDTFKYFSQAKMCI